MKFVVSFEGERYCNSRFVYCDNLLQAIKRASGDYSIRKSHLLFETDDAPETAFTASVIRNGELITATRMPRHEIHTFL